MHFPDNSAGKGSTCNAGDPGSVPRSGRSAGEGIGYPLCVGSLCYCYCYVIVGLPRDPADAVAKCRT